MQKYDLVCQGGPRNGQVVWENHDVELFYRLTIWDGPVRHEYRQIGETNVCRFLETVDANAGFLKYSRWAQ